MRYITPSQVAQNVNCRFLLWKCRNYVRYGTFYRSPCNQKRVQDFTTNLKHLMDLHRVEFSASSESKHDFRSSLTLRFTTFSHTFSDLLSDLHTDTTDIHTKSADVISEPRTHTFINKISREHKLPHSSMLIKNQTSYSAKLLAQWKISTAQAKISTAQAKSLHKIKLSIYASLSSSTTFDTTLSPMTLSQKQKLLL